jgi:hypothetical protein
MPLVIPKNVVAHQPRPERERVLSLAGQLHDFLTFMGGGQDGPDKATLLASLL